jgi:adenylylsulfate kinase
MMKKYLKQIGVVVWFTGLSASGKSTIASLLEEELFKRNVLAHVLDGDDIRKGLNKNLGFSPEDRKENIRRIGEVAKLFSKCGVTTITSFISPYRADRDNARSLFNVDEFIEVYIKVPLEVAEKRDPKGLYKKARSGELKNFTGIDAPYEEPLNPEIIVDTSVLTPEESVQKIISYLKKKKTF